MPPATRPKVAAAVPISRALGRSNFDLSVAAQAIAVPWPPDSPTDPASRPVAGFAPSRCRDANADAILDPQVGDRYDRQHGERGTPGNEHAHVGGKADRGEENDEQAVAPIERERNLGAGDEIEDAEGNRGEDPAGYRLRNVPFPQRR